MADCTKRTVLAFVRLACGLPDVNTIGIGRWKAYSRVVLERFVTWAAVSFEWNFDVEVNAAVFVVVVVNNSMK